MNPILRLILLVWAWGWKARCPHHFHPWTSGWCLCERTYLHWGKHKGRIAPGAAYYWRNNAVLREPMKRLYD